MSDWADEAARECLNVAPLYWRPGNLESIAVRLASLLRRTDADARAREREAALADCEREEQVAFDAHNGERVNDAVQYGSWGAARRIAASIRARGEREGTP
jgi:hypothetical protein